VTGSIHCHYQHQDGGNKNISSLSRVGGGEEEGFSLDSVEDEDVEEYQEYEGNKAEQNRSNCRYLKVKNGKRLY
jgi:hypothetical protein